MKKCEEERQPPHEAAADQAMFLVGRGRYQLEQGGKENVQRRWENVEYFSDDGNEFHTV